MNIENHPPPNIPTAFPVVGGWSFRSPGHQVAFDCSIEPNDSEVGRGQPQVSMKVDEGEATFGLGYRRELWNEAVGHEETAQVEEGINSQVGVEHDLIGHILEEK